MPIFDPLARPVGEIPNPMDEITQAAIDNQAALGLPVVGSPTPQLDVNVPPLPGGPTIGQGPLDPEASTEIGTEVLPEDVAKAREINGEEAPRFADKKVGSDTKTETQTIQSEASKQATKDLEAGSAEAKKAMDVQAKSAADTLKVDAEREEADHKAIASVENARVQVQLANQQKFQQDLRAIEDKVAELSNYKPETFWGNKDTADKLVAAISVGLGSFGQSLTGSGQNVGMVLLQRNMDEFDRNQKTMYDNKLKVIDGMKVSLDEKRKLAEDLDKTHDAMKIAARAQVAAQFDKAAAMAKTPGVIAAIGEKKARLDMDVAKLNQETAAKYEQKVTETSERDLIKRVQLEAGMDADGKPIKLTEGETKARVAYADIAAANKAIKGMDIDKVATSRDYLEYLNETREDAALKNSPWGTGKLIGGARDAIVGAPSERLAKSNPQAAAFEAATNIWTRGVIRYKSGANIPAKEASEERDQYWPVLGDTPEILKTKADARANIEKAMRQAGLL